MKILGAGMSGLLAGQYFKTLGPRITERQIELPDNHKALLRFRTDAIQKETKIKLKKVIVRKMINYKGNHYMESNLFFNNLYSQKVSGRIRNRSISSMEECTRYIAPHGFLKALETGLKIKFGVEANKDIKQQMADPFQPMISTIPMFSLARILGYDLKMKLKSNPIWVITFHVSKYTNCDVYQTVYYPNPTLPFYRISITGEKVIVEFHEDPIGRDDQWNTEETIMKNLEHFLEIDFGIFIKIKKPTFSFQKHGKLIDCHDQKRKDFIAWATRKYNIYSLGRWGTHRQILMDDVMKDLVVIDRLISTNQYGR